MIIKLSRSRGTIVFLCLSSQHQNGPLDLVDPRLNLQSKVAGPFVFINLLSQLVRKVAVIYDMFVFAFPKASKLLIMTP